MRADAKNLLDRLGKQDFAYREFADRFSDLELWPIFDALLKDPRLFDQATNPQIQAQMEAQAQTAQAQTAAPTSPATEPLSSLFSRYESAAQGQPQPIASSASGAAGSQDVRAMLHHLSVLNAKGKL